MTEIPHESGLGWPGDMPEFAPARDYSQGAIVARALAENVLLRSENSALKRENAELEHDALTDPLTGLPNRRAIDRTIETLVEEEEGTFAVMYIDLDDLKKYNTAGGHEGGDILIIDTAQALISDPLRIDTKDMSILNTAQSIIGGSLRAQDSEGQENRPHDITGSDAARVGGDEFVVVLRGIRSQEDLTVINNRIISRLEEAGINASTGAAMHEAGQSAADLIHLADQAMDLNKSERRAARQAEKRAKTLAAMNPFRRAGVKLAGKALNRLGMNPDQYFDVFGHGGRAS